MKHRLNIALVGIASGAAAVLFITSGGGVSYSVEQSALAAAHTGVSETLTLGGATTAPSTTTTVVHTEPSKPTTPPSTLPPTYKTTTTTSVVTPPPAPTTTVVYTERPHPTTTVAPAPPKTTTTIHPTTTTTVNTANVQMLSASCVAADTTISCTWTPSTSAGFAYYDLLRWTNSGSSPTIIFASSDRGVSSHVDGGFTQNATYTYAIVAYAKDGTLLGYSKHTSAYCCHVAG